MDVRIEPGSLADLPAVNAEPLNVGWSPADWWLAPLLELGAGLLLCVRREGQLVGFGSTALFGRTGFIGNMIVVPGERRTGIGGRIFTQLIAWLGERGAHRVELEATEMGRPLYATRFGFEDRRQSRVGRRGDGQGRPPPDDDASAPAEADWPRIAALDRAAYGGDRLAYLRALTTAPGHRAAVVRDGDGVAAFGLASPGRIGPLIARDGASAERGGTGAPGGHAWAAHGVHRRESRCLDNVGAAGLRHRGL